MPYVYSAAPDKWEIDGNGFMRCRARFLAVGIMPYAPEELDLPNLDVNELLDIFVPLDTLSDPHAIRSLEGMPVVAYTHEWAGPDTAYKQVGSVAGTPRIEGPYLTGEIVVTDKGTMEAIKAGELSDISSAYTAFYTMEPGEYDGAHYDGRKSQLRYNHIALLRPGEGRAGRDVRVMNRNKPPEGKTMEYTQIQLPTGHTIRVMNGDVETVNQAFKQLDKKRTENEAASGAQLESLMTELEGVKQEKAAIDQKYAELEGQLQAVKEELEQALSPENVEGAAETMMNEREDGVETLVANECSDRTEAMNSLKGLSGHKLRVHVVNSIRKVRGNDPLTDEQSKNEGFVSGMYETYKATPTSNKKSGQKHQRVAGLEVVQRKAQNSGNNGGRSAMSRLGFPQKSA